MMNKIYQKTIIFTIIVLFIGSNFLSIENVQSYSNNNKEIQAINEPYEEYCLGGWLLPDTVIPNEPGEIGSFSSSWDWRNTEYNGKTGTGYPRRTSHNRENWKEKRPNDL